MYTLYITCTRRATVFASKVFGMRALANSFWLIEAEGPVHQVSLGGKNDSMSDSKSRLMPVMNVLSQFSNE